MSVAIDDHEAVDRRLNEAAVRMPSRSRPLARLSRIVQQAWSTPGRAAATTACGFAVVVAAAAAAMPATVTVTGGGLRERARCGLDVYLYGHPDRAVASACRTAEASRLAVFAPAALIVVAGIVAVIAVGLGSRPMVLKGLPAPAISLPLGLVAAVVAGFALRPADLHLVRGGQLITARCGVDSYVTGYPDGTVERACRHAYGGHFVVLVVALLAAVVIAALVLRRLPAALPNWSRQRLLAAAVGVVLAVIAVIALFPTQVAVSEAGAPVTARCGLDTYLAGYPDHAIESACRHSYSRHALIGLAASADAAACLLAARALRRRPASPTRVFTPEVAG